MHRITLGGHRTEKCKPGGGGTPHILPEQGDKRGGHRTSKFGHMFILRWGHRTKFQKLAVGRMAGWLVGWNMTSFGLSTCNV